MVRALLAFLPSMLITFGAVLMIFQIKHVRARRAFLEQQTRDMEEQAKKNAEILDSLIQKHGPIVKVEHVPAPEPEPEPMTPKQRKAATKDLRKILKDLQD